MALAIHIGTGLVPNYESGEALLRSDDDTILGNLRKVDKVGAVSSHSHYEFRVLLRLSLGIPQFVAADDVELNVRDGAFVIPLPQIVSKQFLVVPLHELWHKPLIHQFSVQVRDLAC